MKHFILIAMLIAFMCTVTQADTITLYETDFESGIDNNWNLESNEVTHVTKKKGINRLWKEKNFSKFIRGWHDGYAELNLTGLGDAPKNITLEFDFYAIDSWDGDGLIGAFSSNIVDRFNIQSANHDLDVSWSVGNASAANHDSEFEKALKKQQENPVTVIKGKLGYGRWGIGYYDHLYRNVQLVFNHTGGDNLSLKFFGSNLAKWHLDESWGIDNMRITATSNNPSSAPEPATMLLMGIGLIGLAGTTRKRLN